MDLLPGLTLDLLYYHELTW